MKSLGLKKRARAVRRLRLKRGFLLRRCFTCDAKGNQPLCQTCLDSLEKPAPGCRRCGNPAVHGDAVTCTWCDRLKYLPEVIFSAFAHRNRGREIYQWVKYRGYWRLLPYLGTALPNSWQESFEALPEPVMVPIPEAFNRKWRRQFNPAEQIAIILAKKTGWPVRKLLKMKPFQATMVGASYVERRRHARQRFYVPGAELPQSVILVDDVLTTGATLEAATKVLRQRGVAQIGWLTLFRTL